MIFFGVFVCAVVGVINAMTQPVVYKAEAIILSLEERDYLKLGSDFQEVTRRSLYLDILNSKPLNYKILQETFNYSIRDKAYETTLMDFFEAETLQEGANAVLGVADFVSEPSGVIKISVEITSADLAAAVANAYVNQLMLYNREKQQKITRDQLKFIKARKDTLQYELSQAEQALVDFQNRNQFLFEGESRMLLAEQAVEYSRLNRSVDTLSGLLLTIISQYEIVRVESKKVVSGIDILSLAEPPEIGSGLGEKKALLISSAAGFFLMVFAAFILEFIQRNRQSGRLEPIIKELQSDIDRLKRLLGKA